MRLGNRDKVAKDTEVAGSTSKCDRYMVEKSTHLNRKISQAVPLTVVTTNCEKSAEATVVKKFL